MKTAAAGATCVGSLSESERLRQTGEEVKK